MATVNMGPGTYAIPVSMFKENRLRVVSELLKTKNVGANSYVLLQGGDSISLYNTDVDYVFRQVRICFIIDINCIQFFIYFFIVLLNCRSFETTNLYFSNYIIYVSNIGVCLRVRPT